MLLVLVMDCFWLVGVAHKRRREEDVHAVNESEEEAAEIFVGYFFFFELLTHKGAKEKGCGDFFGLTFVTIWEFGIR